MASLRSEAAVAEEEYRDQLTARLGNMRGKIALPPPRERIAKRVGGGTRSRGAQDYDWFYALAPAEQQRIRSNWMTPGGTGVDEVEEKIPIREWLNLTRRIDLTRAVATGRQVKLARYGGLEPKTLLAVRTTDKRGRARGRRSSETATERNPRCHFFTDRDGEVHPIREGCGPTADELARRPRREMEPAF